MDALLDIEPAAYRSFNLFVADNRDAWWVSSRGPEAHKVDAHEIPEGVSMLTAWGMDAEDSARTRHYLSRFKRAPAPEPETDNWDSWAALMAGRKTEPGAGPGEAMCIVPEQGFGTLSTSLIALEAPTRPKPETIWRFSETPAEPGTFHTIDLEPVS